MSNPIIDSLKTIFIHVPKTAGLSIDNYLREVFNLSEFTGHHAASGLKLKLGDDFNDYFKFAFVRNPWDRLVSAFYFLDQGGYSKIDAEIKEKYLSKYHGEFSKFVADLPLNPHFINAPPIDEALAVDGMPFLTSHFIEQAYWICDLSNNLLVDHLGRFENLQADFIQICGKLDWPVRKLPLLNASKRGSYASHYSAENAEIVGKLYERDIKLFGYNF